MIQREKIEEKYVSLTDDWKLLLKSVCCKHAVTQQQGCSPPPIFKWIFALCFNAICLAELLGYRIHFPE